MMPAYFTVRVPPTTPELTTVWHAPDMVVTRGVFYSARDAFAWAVSHLGLAPFGVDLVEQGESEAV